MDAHVIDIRLSLWESQILKVLELIQKRIQWIGSNHRTSDDAKLAKKHKCIILFLDEMNSGAPVYRRWLIKLILNRKVGTYELPDNVVIIAAGNREADKGVTYRMPVPLANRFIHLEMKVEFDDWFEWAVDKSIP